LIYKTDLMGRTMIGLGLAHRINYPAGVPTLTDWITDAHASGDVVQKMRTLVTGALEIVADRQMVLDRDSVACLKDAHDTTEIAGVLRIRTDGDWHEELWDFDGTDAAAMLARVSEALAEGEMPKAKTDYPAMIGKAMMGLRLAHRIRYPSGVPTFFDWLTEAQRGQDVPAALFKLAEEADSLFADLERDDWPHHFSALIQGAYEVTETGFILSRELPGEPLGETWSDGGDCVEDLLAQWNDFAGDRTAIPEERLMEVVGREVGSSIAKLADGILVTN